MVTDSKLPDIHNATRLCSLYIFFVVDLLSLMNEYFTKFVDYIIVFAHIICMLCV